MPWLFWPSFGVALTTFGLGIIAGCREQIAWTAFLWFCTGWNIWSAWLNRRAVIRS